jgi:hypothetical protein
MSPRLERPCRARSTLAALAVSSRFGAVAAAGHAAPAPPMRLAGVQEQPSASLPGALPDVVDLRRGEQLGGRAGQRPEQSIGDCRGSPCKLIPASVPCKQEARIRALKLPVQDRERVRRPALGGAQEAIERLAELDRTPVDRRGRSRIGEPLCEHRPPLRRTEKPREPSPFGKVLERREELLARSREPRVDGVDEVEAGNAAEQRQLLPCNR